MEGFKRETSTVGSNWTIAALCLGASMLFWAYAYHDTLGYLARLWNQVKIGEYAHGYLVVAVSLYLVWTMRDRLAHLSPCPDFRALPAVLISGLVWMLGVVVSVRIVEGAAQILLLLSMTWALLGPASARTLSFPILFLSFALPAWSVFLPLMQDFTSRVVFETIRGIGVPAFLNGHVIELPAGRFMIDEGCSGLRYVLAALTIGTLYAYLTYDRLWKRVTVVAVAMAAAIFANLLRVFLVVWKGYQTDMQHPWVEDHLWLGWVLFGGLIAVLLAIDHFAGRHAPPASDTRPNEGMSAGGNPVGTTRYLMALALTISAMAIGPVLADMVSAQGPASQRITLVLPAGVAGWEGPYDVSDDTWEPAYRGAAQTVKGEYRRKGDAVIGYTGYFDHQTQGAELINVTNSISGDGWLEDGEDRKVDDVPGGSVLEAPLRSGGGGRRLVWYWYEIAGVPVVNEYGAKLLQLWGIVSGDTGAYIVAVAADYGRDSETARDTLGRFLADMRERMRSAGER